MNILIVDDNEDARMILKKTLESNGYSVRDASNGKEALKAAKESPPDMIISDILMPQMDGFHLCREVMRNDRLRGAPFVFYTATYTDEKDEELALKLGADRFIRKPMEPDEFLKIIQDVIKAAENGRLKARPVKGEEKGVFKLYNERLVKKLEKKMLDLERGPPFRCICPWLRKPKSPEANLKAPFLPEANVFFLSMMRRRSLTLAGRC